MNECLNSGDYAQTTKIITEKFIKVSVPTFDFSIFKLVKMCNLEVYYDKKVDLRIKLKLRESLTFQVLIDDKLAPEYTYR